MKYLQIFVLFLGITTFTACDFMNPCGSTKEEFLTNYDTFIKEIEQKELAHDASEWTSHDREFKQMVEECYEKYEAEMSVSEQIGFWTNALAYYYQRYGTDMIAVLGDSSDELSVKVSEKAKEVLENPSEVFRKILGDSKGDELDKLLRDFGKDFNKWSKKIENLLEK